MPEFATADENGQWIEGHEVDPDILIEQDPVEVLPGDDPERERAISELMQLLPEEPGRLPQRPAAPVKTGVP